MLLDKLAARAAEQPTVYGHWYIDGGQPVEKVEQGVTCISYGGLEAARRALLRKMQTAISSGGIGPEGLRTLLAQMGPGDLGLDDSPADTVVNRFQVALMTEGSGTQIFSTTFCQWAAREVLRRAQPLTLLLRFAPRQSQQPMNELLSPNRANPEIDSPGSLVDGDMGAYYTWLNQQRLSSAERSSFLVWFEGHTEALAIGPSMPHGTESSTSADLNFLLRSIS
jgi:hypothetical protein